MNKIELTFKDYSEEDKEIYEWLSTKDYCINFIKGLLSNKMLEEKNRQARKELNYTDKDIKQIASEVLKIFGETEKQTEDKKITSKELDELFKDDSFWD